MDRWVVLAGTWPVPADAADAELAGPHGTSLPRSDDDGLPFLKVVSVQPIAQPRNPYE